MCVMTQKYQKNVYFKNELMCVMTQKIKKKKIKIKDPCIISEA